MRRIALLFSVLCLLLSGCGRTTGQIPSDLPQGSSAADQAPQETASGTAQSELFPDDEIPKLFDAFYRMEQSRSRRTGGSGLGLYIVKTILEQHHMAYSLKNTEKGVLFSIRF